MNLSRRRLVAHFAQCARWLDTTSIRATDKPRLGQSCDFDCCGNPIIKKKDVIVEKNLELCMYDSWRPKIPELGSELPKPCKKIHPGRYVPKICYAGMEPPPIPVSCTSKPKECKIVDPVPRAHPPSKGPQMQICCNQMKTRTPKQLPFPDWDVDCV